MIAKLILLPASPLPYLLRLPNNKEYCTMADGDSSPLFMPQGTPEGNSSPAKHGDGAGSGNDSDRGSISIKSERGTPEFESATDDQAFWDDSNSKIAPIPGANMEPEVKDEDERFTNHPRHINAFPARGRPTRFPRPFAPLTSRAERQRRKAANGSANHDNDATPCLLYTSPSPRDGLLSRMPSSA